MAVPVLVAAPYALAGDNGSNAFSYRLPAVGLGILAAAAAVLVLTGVLVTTGRADPPEWVGVALLVFGAVPLLWAGYRQLRPLDETGARRLHDAYLGVSLGDPEARAVEVFGPARPAASSVAPLDENFDAIGGPPFIGTPGSTLRALRYRDVTVLTSDGRVYGFVITDEDAETMDGVGVGDNLDVAEDRYSGLDCGIARATKYRTFPYCSGRLAPRRWIWFGQDPIKSIVLATTELGPD